MSDDHFDYGHWLITMASSPESRFWKAGKLIDSQATALEAAHQENARLRDENAMHVRARSHLSDLVAKKNTRAEKAEAELAEKAAQLERVEMRIQKLKDYHTARNEEFYPDPRHLLALMAVTEVQRFLRVEGL